MSTIEQMVKNPARLSARSKPAESILSRFLRVICSVRLGVTLLSLLGLACLIGMLIMQQNVDGFDRYFAELTPAQRLVYGSLGLFDIYRAWYFNALLCLVSTNIVLASVDRFPKTWKFVSKPNLTVPVRWLRDQSQTSELQVTGSTESITRQVMDGMKAVGWRNVGVTEKAGRTFVFGQSGTWNRFGYLAVHVGLLTIFAGGFLTAQLGSTGQMPLSPGQSTDLMFETVADLDKASEITKRLPFNVACIDMLQRLIKKDGSLAAQNTIDWMTTFTITDETGTHEAFVQMNRPFDYRGYRFFQASFTPVGRARSIKIKATPAGNGDSQEISINRDGTGILVDGTRIMFNEFRGNFRVGGEDPNENTSDYVNPAAVLQVTPAGSGSGPQTAYAFRPQMANLPVSNKPVGGYTFQLTDFEKVADQHILSVQHDPGATVVYVGFILLFTTLVGVFFFSHQRVWAAIENGDTEIRNVVFGGNTNRSPNAFDEKFRRFISTLETKRT